MRERVDQIGRVHWICHRCVWRAAGRCWQCGRPREKPGPRAAYCRRCKMDRDNQFRLVSTLEPEQVIRRRQWDKRARQRPGHRERNTQHKRQWIAAHPDKKAEYAEKARLRYHAKRADPAWWDRIKAQQRARYAKRRAQALDASS